MNRPVRTFATVFRIVVALGGLFVAETAQTLPRFAASNGAQCSRCHVNPTGGGARNRYGHNVFASHVLTMELFAREPLLNAEFPLGEPLTVGLGSDLRAAYHYRKATQPTETFRSTFFPMQTDLYVHAAVGRHVTLYLDRGFNNFEAFGMVHDSQKEFWAKAGQFVLPYGLRLANHSAYVRTATGFDPRGSYYGLDTAVEGGASLGPVRIIAAVANGASPSGGRGLFDENTRKAVVGTVDWAHAAEDLRLRAGVSGYHNFSGRRTAELRGGRVRLQQDDRLQIDQLAAFGSLSISRFTLVNEADLVRERDYDTDPTTLEESIATTTQIATYHQFVVRAAQGVDVKLSWEYLDGELGNDERPTHRMGLATALFPATGFEWQLLYRHTVQPGTDGDEVLTFAHFYF